MKTSKVKITARAKAFSGEGARRNLFLVEGSEVMVWDSVAGHFTDCNSLSDGAKARIARLARSAA
jgi:hypothetical protein